MNRDRSVGEVKGYRQDVWDADIMSRTAPDPAVSFPGVKTTGAWALSLIP
jgi:hypothetical protein